MPDIHIRLIAPSGYPHDRAAMTRGVERLRDAGCVVSGLEVLDRSEQRYAGSDAERAADLNALATMDALPDIALAIRGGYGATRLLEQLHYDALRERLAGGHTMLVGHSDFTALQLALYAKSGLCTLQRADAGRRFRRRSAQYIHLRSLLEHRAFAHGQRRMGDDDGTLRSTWRARSGAAISRCSAA